MPYRVEELAVSSELSVATIRYYQLLGLLPPPCRQGRIGVYEEQHLLRLREIRRLAELGFSLKQIGSILSGDDPLAAILIERAGGGETITKQDLIEASGLSAELIDLAVELGFLHPIGGDDHSYPRTAIEMLRAAVALLEEEVDQTALVDLALRHAEHVENTVSEAIELFRPTISSEDGREHLAALMQRILPHVIQLVSSHFHLTLLRQVGERAHGAGTGVSAPPEPAEPAAVTPPDPEAPEPAAAAEATPERAPDSSRPRPVRPRYECHELTDLTASVDGAAVLAAAGQQPRFLWMQPRKGLTLVGVGAAREWHPASPAHFESAFRQAVAALISEPPETAASSPPNTRTRPSHAPQVSGSPETAASSPPNTAPWLYGGFGFYAPAADPVPTSPADPVPTSPADPAAVSPQRAHIPAHPSITADSDDRQDSPSDRQDSPSDRQDFPEDWQDFPSGCLVLPKILGIDRGNGFRWSLILQEECTEVDLSAAKSETRALLEAAAGIAKRRVGVSGELLASGELEESYRRLVRSALEQLAAGNLDKVVAARRASVKLSEGAHPALVRELLLRLSERFEVAATFAIGRGPSTFLGSTPELLLHTENGMLHTAALAGSRPRSNDPSADGRLAAELLANPKERAEHAAVVDHLYARLRSAGVSFVDPLGEPAVNSLPGIHHLHTSLRGAVDTPPGELWRLAALLHPTPAVGGLPTSTALDFLRSEETFKRGWFAAPLGYCDLQGNGELALALRCGLLREHSAEMAVFAGAGVMEDSTPEGELDETLTKLGAMLSVLDPATLTD